MLGVGVSDRDAVAEAGLFTKAYYTLGLFVLGGMDLGMPVGGPPVGRALLWFAYYAAPTITASAVIEGLLRALGPRVWMLRRMRRHVVIAGCGKLTMLYLARLREVDRRRPVVIVETQPDRPNLDEARVVFGATIVTGDIRNSLLLAALRLDRAERVLLLTGDDFTNLDTAAAMLRLVPDLGPRTIVHVGDLGFMRVMAHTSVARECHVFNTHQIAAEHLVRTRLLDHFQHTAKLDVVVLAGFGRFGQTVLAELQRRAAGKFELVVIVDFDVERRLREFDDQVGFSASYGHVGISGDLSDPGLWAQVAERHGIAEREPAFVLGSGNDGVNLQAALRLSSKYPGALIIARGFLHSSFAEEVSNEGHFHSFSIADLVSQSLPDGWLGRGATMTPVSQVGARSGRG